jgi:DNA repair protein RadC
MHLLNIRDQIARVGPGECLRATEDRRLIKALGTLVGQKNVELAMRLVAISGLQRLSASELCSVCGFGTKIAERIVAARDLSRTLLASGPVAPHAPAVLGLVPPDMTALDTEILLGFALAGNLRVIASLLLAKGGAAGLGVRPRDVFTPLVRLSAAAVVLLHNHPSGDPTPSGEDIRFTRDIACAGQVLGIDLVDHIILADRGFTSLAAEGLLPHWDDRGRTVDAPSEQGVLS